MRANFEGQQEQQQLQPQQQSSAVKAKVARAGVDRRAAQSQEEREAAEAALRLYRAAEGALRGAAAEDTSRNPLNEGAAAIAYTVSEARTAKEAGVKWRDRGPRGENAPSVWRGQRWRENSSRYSSRGGKRKEEFALLFRNKGKGNDGCKGKDKEGGSDKGKGGGSDKGGSSNKGKEKGRKGKRCISDLFK